MKTKPRGTEYRRALASLSDEDAGTALACYVFSSLPQKLDNVKALRIIEAEPGFAGWGTFVRKPSGPVVPVRSSRRSPRSRT
jgi:hypothetical protein